MIIAVPKETDSRETRVILSPEYAKKLLQNEGLEIIAEKGLGATCNYSDDDYIKAGVKIIEDREELLKSADIIIRIRKPEIKEVSLFKKGAIHISFLDPFNEKELVLAMKSQGVKSVSLEMIPRTTLAQKMDVLSSQASLAGYVAVSLSAQRLNKIFPMMMTPAGTISPSRVFIIGAGVAGLQAIATAKRLGARVEAFDTRPAVAEQVESLGAKFVKVDLGEMGETKGGYAKQLSPEQLEKQRQAMAKLCASSDIVITTAKLFGRKSPIIITDDMIASMKEGSIIVDLAAETGGNTSATKLDEIVNVNGVEIIGLSNLEGRVPVHSSQMLSSNITALLNEFWNKEEKIINFDMKNEIAQGCVITDNGEIVNEKIKSIIEGVE